MYSLGIQTPAEKVFGPHIVPTLSSEVFGRPYTVVYMDPMAYPT